jgi:hypothetical protein
MIQNLFCITVLFSGQSLGPKRLVMFGILCRHTYLGTFV